MTKYDFEIDLGLNTSTGMILNKIPSGATVLEFGSAAGRMTRYMKNALDCCVYIVEYDKDAFEAALQYAVDGVCDDILRLSWMERFKEIEFDVILFADVLEHLPKPEIAVSNAAKLLKEQGKILISIPNIAHNDILLKAFHNHFDYTDIGLLDNTHVHFWGYENIIPFAEENGLYVYSIEATYLPTGRSEQFAEELLNCSIVLLNYFKERQFAEAYQFVIELGRDKRGDSDKEGLKISYKKNSVTSHIYIDEGKGFCAENVIEFDSENTTPGRYVVHYVLDNMQNVMRLRFDPLEYQGCIIQNLSIRQAGKELEYVYSDYLKFSEGILMLGTDPMILVERFDDFSPVVIDADIIIYGEEYLYLVQQACANKYFEVQDLNQKLECFVGEIGKLHSEVNHLNVENIKLQEEVTGLNAEKIRLQGEAAGLNVENAQLQSEIADLNVQNKKLHDDVEKAVTENNVFQREIGGYIHLANEKDRLLLRRTEQLSDWNTLLAEKDKQLSEQNSLLSEKDRQLTEQNSLICEKDERLLEKDNYITELENKVDYYKNRTCIKLFDRFWKTYWAIRLRFRRVIRKKEDA